MLDMARSSEAVKPRVCEQHGDGPWITPRPDPKTILIRYGKGHEAEIAFVDWDCVFGFIMRDGVTALRNGTKIILTDAHWAQQVWGRG